jgi:hypothetical protein
VINAKVSYTQCRIHKWLTNSCLLSE